MTDREPIETTNLDIYGSAELPWSRPRDLLAANPAGPGMPYFTSGPGARKARNLAANPAATLSVGLEGIDVVVEGEASRVTDSATLEKLAGIYNELGWPAKVEGDAFTVPYSAPSAGPPPWHVYRLVFSTVFAVASAEPHGATRWRFDT